ncbi:MAG: aldehyde dehydrogenase [Gammaproteobacteria bacterium]|nr:aldehyde dehydrogenase [Gammaproteobacteria bacterium]
MRERKSAAHWRGLAEQLDIRTRAFIDGRYVDAASGETFTCINPATGRPLAEVAATSDPDVDTAVAAARRAFDSGHWSRLPPVKRKRVLQKLASLVREHREELALLESLDMGKPVSDSLTIDIPAVANCLDWYAEAIDKVYGEVAPTGDNMLGMITREPIGVVAAIVPWNFPLLMAAWKLGPALATGNSVVLKPSEKSPLTAIRLAELATAAGLPDGVLNVLPGFGHTAGQALALHNDVDCLVFTGSTRVGKKLLEYAGQSNMKRVWLECGGKTPNIVMADCADLDAAARAAAFAIFFNQGEMCSAGSRLLVDVRIKDELLDKVISTAKTLKPGDPLDPATRMGAIVDDKQFETVLRYIAAGTAGGAILRMGGHPAKVGDGGYFIEPTIFDEVRNDMRIAQEEIFGPVLSTIRFETVEEAVEIANDVQYGLAAALWTSDVSTAHRVARRLRAGTVWVNCFEQGDLTVPFGGYKQSGTGRDKSLHALDKYTELKTTWLKLS